ncbi:hypothetical protein MFLAVUS_008201 [Mucor flavus]|uniref:G-protein coupled receptors family 1 profile domain-containing protein n=1 Tax=Mucor flavus TaxID=439312 RepID=A0ABP9Z6E9_9FUNG
MNMTDDVSTTVQLLEFDLVNPDGLEVASELTSLACITVLALTLVMLIRLSLDNMISCTLGMLACDFFYAGSKIVIYAWLIERVHLVTAVKTVRMKTKMYKFHLLLLCPYIIIFVLMPPFLTIYLKLCFRNIYLEPNGSCTIGLQQIASIPLLVYDFIFNLYLTWLFMRPLTSIGIDPRTDWKTSRLYKLAKRTLVASVVCLSISFCNVLYVVISNGHQRGLVCLTMCTVDVNVVTVHWVTTTKSSGNTRTKTNRDDQITAEMTFDDDRYGMQFDGPMMDTYSISSTADVSHSSKKPINIF